MMDVFDPELEDVARSRNITRVPVTWIAKAGEANAKGKPFLGAHVTEPWVFKAGVRIVAGLEREPRRDSLHHRSSGLDSTTARQCAEHGILVAIDLSLLRTLDPVTIGRTMQNITLCRRYGARMCVISNATTAIELPHAHDVHGLLVSLGMGQGEASGTLTALGEAYRAHAKR
jgi:hypothetical protein